MFGACQCVADVWAEMLEATGWGPARGVGADPARLGGAASTSPVGSVVILGEWSSTDLERLVWSLDAEICRRRITVLPISAEWVRLVDELRWSIAARRLAGISDLGDESCATVELERTLTAMEAAGYLERTERHVRWLCESGRLAKAVKHGHIWAIPFRSLVDFLPHHDKKG